MLLTLGLFESAADVAASIRELGRENLDRGQICLLVRDLDADIGEQSSRHTTIAQVLDILDLAPAAKYLDTTGLVVIPEEGTYLAAGWPVRELTGRASERQQNQTELCRLLIGIGCAAEEAGFLDSRLQAGTFLLGVADDDEERLKAVYGLFAEQQAIHVSLASIPPDIWNRWKSADIPKPDTHTAADGVVLDVSVLMVIEAGEQAGDHGMIGRTLFGDNGFEIGTISAIVVDPREHADLRPEYVVVKSGGFLGVGRNEYVIPLELIDGETDSGSFRARLTREIIENAPAFDPELPISRREEQSICGYYGTIPYWER